VVVGVWCAQVHRDVAPLFPAMSVTLPFILLLFALGWLLRHRPIPRALSWLGLVSYSLYLIHRVVFDAVLPPGPSERTLPVQAVLAVGLVLALWGTLSRALRAAPSLSGLSASEPALADVRE
jgi:peptidoglycan/LPS O-acetylase OafA/YrhL